MSNQSIDRLTVLGAGVLGTQIAWHSAVMGKTVVLYDKFEESVERSKKSMSGLFRAYQKDDFNIEDLESARERLSFSTNLAAAVEQAGLVIESVPEVIEVKKEVYAEMASLLKPDTIIATNSSTLLPRYFAEDTGRPDRYAALHFANVIWKTNLAEVMGHPGTSDETLEALTRFSIEIGMVPIPVAREQNGYVLNTWLTQLMESSLSLVVKGVCTPEDVDRTYLIANRGASTGPFGMLDVVGMRTVYNITHHWATVLGDEGRMKQAEWLKTNYLDKGYLGIESGRGVYIYPNPAYKNEDFLKVPSLDEVKAIAARARLTSSPKA